LGGKRGISSKLAEVAEGGVAKRVEDLEAAAAGPILLRVEEDFAWLVVLEPDADEEEEEEEEEVEGEGRLGVEDDDLNRRAVAPITEDDAENADGRVINRKFEEERAEREDAGAILPPSWRVEGQAVQAFREITGRSMLVAQIVDHNAQRDEFLAPFEENAAREGKGQGNEARQNWQCTATITSRTDDSHQHDNY
jgi:hypothetical protein